MAIRAVLLVVLVPFCAVGLPEGPPVDHHPEVCVTMSPGRHHPNNTATGPAPYSIVVSTDTCTAGQPIQVTVRANEGVTFSGFFVQARNQSDSSNTDALGTFSNVPQGSQVLPCTSSAGSWAHSNDQDRTEITASWTPPSDTQGPLAFQATVVKGPASVYWEGVKSPPLSCAASSLVPSNVFILTTVVLKAMMG